jgi:hypothetical protein
MKTIKILCSLLCTMLLAALPATAQNNDDKNKAIIETNEGSQELNTDDIQLIRFDGGKITIVQPWGDTFFDRTLRSLSFERPNPGTLRLTATTSIGSDSSNRAQAIDGDGKLASTWAAGDVVYVYADASTTTSIGTLEPKSDDYGKSTATLSGNINAEGLSNGQTLYFSTKPRPFDFSSQDGTVESLFYFTATGTITINGANASIEDLNFSRPIAIVKFTLKDKADGTSPVYAKTLTVNDGTSNYVITPAALSNVLFVGIPAITSQTVTLTASDGLSSYSYERANVTFEDNGYYAINVKMTNNTDYLTIPLTFEAKVASTVVSFSSTMDTTPTIEYSLNGGDWTTYSSSITLTNVGDKVSFRGNNATYAISYYKYSSFSCTKDCYIYGNIMGLTSKEGFASATSLTENYAFCKLFYDNTHICDHASKTLKLPATTLTEWCYYVLFRGCSQLTKAPELPATTLADYCYANMFASCSGLATAPELPATNLAEECYTGMFSSCTGLKVAPALPATTMAIRCYYTMFSGCTGLTSAPVLPAMTLATNCYYGMFWGCTGLTSGPALPATTLEEGCYWCMFYNCSNLVSAPALPATTMKKLCYYSMFEGCSKLTTPPALPATTMAEDCYGYMFRGCSELQSAPALPATSMVKDCYYGMFMACSSLSTPPELPATSLKESCYAYMFYNCTSLTSSPVLSVSHLYNKEYSNMFYGCSNLSSVTCLAIYVGSGSVSNWLNGVAASGTFYKAPSMTGWTTGVSGIPSGWTTENYVEGALKGKFTINSGGGKVYFSQGNLQYQASTDTWRFTTSQYEAIGSGNSNVSASYDGWIDSFGWGSGNQPTQTSEDPNVYSTFVDWGTNAISNGGNTANLWRTLSESEWTYLVFTRPNASSKRGRATIDGMYCFVLLPDDWVLPSGLSFTPDANNWTNVYTAEQWAQMEAAGAVCLPASGSRAGGANNTNVNNFNEWCCYWSSTSANSTQGYNLWITNNHIGTTDKGNYQMGASVRLVYEKPYFQGSGTEADPYLISSEADWNYLAVKVNSGTNYSGKFFRLDADIDVTTMVGNSESNSFRGTFDGDGHTLTINYNTTSDYTAPFRYIQGATFKNLKVTGSITTTMNLAAGIAGLNTNAVATFEQCATDVTINSSSTTEVGWGRVDYHGGLLARTKNVNVNITDCVCGGSVDGSNSATSIAYGASFVGVAEGCTVTGTRCLSTTSYTNVSIWNPLCHAADATRSTSIFYYVNGNDVCDGATQVTLSDLNNSSYATALQAGRSTTVWVQDSRTNQPMLKQFTKYTVTYNANGGSGSVPAAQAKQHGDDLTLSNSTLTLSGFTHTGWNTSSDGTGTHYDIGGTYSANADVTLYAEWTSLTFNYTGDAQTFTVPATGYYTLECYGAQGGYNSGGLGGKGGLSQLTYPLTKGDILYIYVGGQGECIDGNSSHPTGGDGGWNGGGKGGTGVAFGGSGNPYNGGGGGGGATHIATSAIGAITNTTDFNANHDGLLLIAGGGGGGLSWGSSAGGAGGGAEGGNGHRGNDEWNIAWNNGTLSCGRDGMTSSNGGGSCEGCGGGGGGYQGGNTWTVSYNASNQSYSGAGGSSWGETTNGKSYTTTTGGATEGGNGKAVITWYGTTYPTE